MFVFEIPFWFFQVKDGTLQHEVEFRLLLFDSCSNVDDDIIKVSEKGD